MPGTWAAQPNQRLGWEGLAHFSGIDQVNFFNIGVKKGLKKAIFLKVSFFDTTVEKVGVGPARSWFWAWVWVRPGGLGLGAIWPDLGQPAGKFWPLLKLPCPCSHMHSMSISRYRYGAQSRGSHPRAIESLVGVPYRVARNGGHVVRTCAKKKAYFGSK